MSYRIIGTCSLCSGAVAVPSVWAGIKPPIPTCLSCKATPRTAYGPRIDMQRPDNGNAMGMAMQGIMYAGPAKPIEDWLWQRDAVVVDTAVVDTANPSTTSTTTGSPEAVR